MKFIESFLKTAKKQDDKKSSHIGSRILMGNPASAAYHAKKGKGIQAFSEARTHAVKEGLLGLYKGLKYGGGAGALTGAGLAAHQLIKRNPREAAKRLAIAMGTGSLGGAAIGGQYGAYKGHFGDEATKIHKKYQE